MIAARVSGLLSGRCSPSVQSMERLFCSGSLMIVANGTTLFRKASLSWVSSVTFFDPYVTKAGQLVQFLPAILLWLLC